MFPVAAATVLGLVLMRPVLLAPVAGDDTWDALRSAGDAQRTLGHTLATLDDTWHRRVANGRVTC